MVVSRQLLAPLVALLSLAAVAAPVAAQATPDATPALGGARLFELPGEAVYPEGVAYDQDSNAFFVGSSADGTIYRGDVATGEVTVFSEAGADGRTSAAGMKIDQQGRLVVAGGPIGAVWVYDLAGGNLLAQFRNDLPEGATFLNDVAITPAGDAYVTDSFSPTLYRIPADALAGEVATPSATPEAGNALEAFVAFADTPFAYQEGFNANGIVATADGAFLLVVQANTGNLYRIDAATGAVTQVTLEGGALTNGDGMLLDGRLLYVVRNQDEQIVPVGLGEDFATGTLSEPFTDPSFNFPTTIARYDTCLLVVNSQFGAQQTGQPELPFTVSAIPIPSLDAVVADAATPAGSVAAGGC